MTTVIPDADCEAIVENWTGGDLWLAMNTGAPGKTGANQSTGLGRVLIATADGWTAFADYTIDGGRMTTNAEDLLFGATTAEETLTHASLWSAETDGTYRGGAQLLEPVDLVIGETLTITAGTLRMIGTGSGTVAE